MENKLCFVQFMHPGGEHTPDTRGPGNLGVAKHGEWTAGDIKSWNENDHKRKFLVNKGRYIRDGKVCADQIMFWGEWEPESEVVEVIPWNHHYPCHVYRPYYMALPVGVWKQNTDPFVFGDTFLYSCCRQFVRERETQLRYLSPGSVLLFGSCIERSEFVLDTVFVVARCIDYHPNDTANLNGHISRTFQEVTIDRLAAGSKTPRLPHRLYFGATYDEPFEGMYSFVPCMPYQQDTGGFPRPRLQIPGIIKNNLYMGKKLNPQANIADVKALWDDVSTQVFQQGLMFGISVELPERRGGIASEQ